VTEEYRFRVPDRNAYGESSYSGCPLRGSEAPYKSYLTSAILLSIRIIYRPDIMTQINPLNYLAVKNVLSRYCQVLDSKDFASLSKVFTQDVVADYPFNPSMTGVEVIVDAIKNRYTHSGTLLLCAGRARLTKFQPRTHSNSP
jgi:hypothetical protein